MILIVCVLLIVLGWNGAAGDVLTGFACFGGVAACMQARQIYKRRVEDPQPARERGGLLLSGRNQASGLTRLAR